MYQLLILITNNNNHATNQIIHKLSTLDNYKNIVTATKSYNSIVYISYACEEEYKLDVMQYIRKCIIDIYLTIYKQNYIERKLKTKYFNKLSKMMLVNTLVAFDRDSEEKLLNSEIVLTDNFCIDGFFNFKMRDIKYRWGDMCKLTTDNAQYLYCDRALYELLKFLLSAVKPKLLEIEILQNDSNNFTVTSHGYNDDISQAMFNVEDDLLLYLIDNAPEKITIKGNMNNNTLLRNITSIFDGAESKL